MLEVLCRCVRERLARLNNSKQGWHFEANLVFNSNKEIESSLIQQLGTTMKKLTLFISTIVLTLASLQSQATTITLSTDQLNYNIGDTVLLDIAFENVSLDTAELGFNLNFDSSALIFDSFDFSTEVINSAFLPAADVSFFDNNIIEVFVLWLDSTYLPGSNFFLGQVSFTAQQNYSPEFALTDSYLADANGADLDAPTVSVPAPATGLLVLFGFLLLPIQKKLLAKQK
tara:strand:- start:60254 stop:60940 length:687 start_codon:yes stop_codon:yes gene_type:complete